MLTLQRDKGTLSTLPRSGCADKQAAMAPIYKILSAAEWERAVAGGVFRGSPDDLRDGFIHFSTAKQVRETAARYFHRQSGLLLVAFDASALGAELRYEPSRGGDLFPHLYAPLDPALAMWAKPLPLGVDGAHVFPDLPA
jgi:uncharacterized protein (DUF952 family)